MDVGSELLRVEILQSREFTNSSDDITTAIKLSRACVHLTDDDTVVGLGVTFHRHMLDGSLITFTHTHLKVDGVVFHPNLNRINTEEEVSVIHV